MTRTWTQRRRADDPPPIPAPASPIRFGFLVLPDLNLMALVAAIDPLRAANYVSGQELYHWRVLSLDGGPVTASNGLAVTPDGAVREDEVFDAVFVCSSWTPERHKDRGLFGWLRYQARRGTVLGGLDTGAIVLAHAGLLDGHAATAHFEHLDGFAEDFPDVQVVDQLFVADRDRITCCGGAASTDCMLSLVELHFGTPLANAAAHYILVAKVRPAGESQRHPIEEPIRGVFNRKVLGAISIMEENLEAPLAADEVARRAGLSLRHMERLFKEHLGTPPGAFYMSLRLERARGLLTQTDMRVYEVAVACGFASPEHFARCYKAKFGLTPKNDSVVGRISFQFRLVPTHGARELRRRP